VPVTVTGYSDRMTSVRCGHHRENTVWHARDVIEMPASEVREGDSGAGLRLVVGAAVVDDLDAPTTLLAARRTLPASLAGGWELPGGKVEPGEAPEDALHRELAEELGVRVQVGAEVTPPDGDGWPLSPVHRMRVWLVRIVDGEPLPLEDHDAVRVLGPGEWFDVAWLPADVPVVRALTERAGHRRAG
jgi:8-oxo-dGTP diphosphatase